MVTLHSAGEPRFAIGMSHPKVSEGLHQKRAANKDRPLLRSGRYAPIFVCRALQASSSAWIVRVMLAPPPLLVVFPTKDRLLLAASLGLPPDEIKAVESLVGLCLPPATSIPSLSLLFGISPYLTGAVVRNPNRYYRTFEIQSGKRTRRIHTPKVALKVIKSWFGYHLGRAIGLSDHVHGFVPSRSTVTAARTHCPARWVLSVDIRDFFGSVTPDRVFACIIFRRSSSRCARLYAARTLFRSACASCSSIRSGCQPCSFKRVDAIVRSPWPVISSLEKPIRRIATFGVPSEIGRVFVRSDGKMKRPEPVSG